MCYSLFTHLPIDGHLCDFQVLSIMYKAAGNIGAQVFV